MSGERPAGRLARIAAVARRDLTIQLSYHFQFVARFVQIFVLLATVYFASKLITDAPQLDDYGGDYFSFVLVGLVITSFVTLGMGTFTSTIYSELQGGTMELLLSSPTGLGTLLAGALVVPLALTVVSLAIYIILGVVVFGANIPLAALTLSVPLLLMTLAVFSGVGILSASFVVLTKRGDPMSLLVGQASTFAAGAIFPVSVLPGPIQLFARLVPAFYTLRAVRGLLLSGAGFSSVVDELGVLALFAILLLPLSLLAFRAALRQARIAGTLGNY